jgi:hypothetical protein
MNGWRCKSLNKFVQFAEFDLITINNHNIIITIFWLVPDVIIAYNFVFIGI